MQTFTKNKWLGLCLISSWAVTAIAPAAASGLENRGIDADARQASQRPYFEYQESTPVDALAITPASAPPPHSAAPNWIAVSYALLDQMRGGFTVESGLKVSFGIERSVSINGELQTITKFDFQDTGTFAAHAPSAGALQLIQNGLGNTFLPGSLSQASAATFIQNSLNNQSIQSLTIINASTNSLALMKSMNLHSTLQDAVTHTTGVR